MKKWWQKQSQWFSYWVYEVREHDYVNQCIWGPLLRHHIKGWQLESVRSFANENDTLSCLERPLPVLTVRSVSGLLMISSCFFSVYSTLHESRKRYLDIFGQIADSWLPLSAYTGTIWKYLESHGSPVTRGVRSFLRGVTEPVGPARRIDTSSPSGDQLVVRLESSGHRKMPVQQRLNQPKTEVLPCVTHRIEWYT